MRSWIEPYVRKHKGLMSLTVLLGILGIGSGVMLLFISGFLISKSALRPENIMVVYVPIVAVRTFSISQAAMLYLERLVGHDVILRILEKMRTRLYRALEPQALFLHDRYQTGDLLNMLAEDIEQLQNLYLKTIFPSIIALVMYALLVGVLGLFDWVFALIMALVLAVIIFLIPFISLKMTSRKYKTIRKSKNDLYSRLTDAVFGLSDWQASGRTNAFLTDYTQNENKLHEVEKKLQRWQHIRSIVVQLFSGIAVILMIIWTGNLAQTGEISPTLIAAFVLMMLALTDALAPTSEAIEQIPLYEESLNRVNSTEMTAGALSHTNIDRIEEKNLEKSSFLEAVTGEITVKNLSFRYPNSDTAVLDNLNFTVKAGEKLAILGRSGVGKSTLLKLLTGALQPTMGSIIIDGHIANTDRLGSSISILNQKPHLFDTTIANNIRIGNSNASDEAIAKVVDEAQLTHLVSTLPKGLKTQMEEMGHRFSGGERQRIAFARVLVQQSPIIIFDEPTIGLDPKTEHALLQTMFRATEEKTIIWVTHHLAHIEQMDNIIFLEDGAIALHGKHDYLMSTSAKYRELYTMDKGF